MVEVTLRGIRDQDADVFARRFTEMGWSKPASLFRRYALEHATGLRWVSVAEVEGELAGYVTLLWDSDDRTFRNAGIPEVVDLNVLPSFRRRGVGTALLDSAESEAAARSDVIGIRVGLHSGYGAAQRLYVARGYKPDGSGAVIRGDSVAEGATVQLNDDLTLRLTLTLPRPS